MKVCHRCGVMLAEDYPWKQCTLCLWETGKKGNDEREESEVPVEVSADDKGAVVEVKVKW